jgi:hypothetical protein
MRSYLDFEKPVAELEAKADELRGVAETSGSPALAKEIEALDGKARQQLRELYAALTPWQKTMGARHPMRPHCADYLQKLVEDFSPLAGDRSFGEDEAIIGGIGLFRGRPVCVIGQEKVSYTSNPTPGKFYITEMGLQAPVKKNRPDRFQVLTGADGSLDHVNTTAGQQVASSLYPEQMMKLQNRESMGMLNANPASTAAAGGMTYIRAFTEPFQEFMKLTVEGRAPPAGPVGGMAVQAGPQSYNVQTHRDESLHNNTRGFEAPLMTFGGQAPSASQQGSTRYTEPLKQDVYTERNEPSILSAFNQNPYSQKLNSF